MSNIAKIDKNFMVNTTIDKKDIKFYPVDQEPFKIYGIFKENGKYRRMPEDKAKLVNDGVYQLHTQTAGGRVRFITDSPYIAIHADMEKIEKMSHLPLTCSAGFDMYVEKCHTYTFIPPFNVQDGYEGIFEFSEKKLREITINFPSYSTVKNLYIGLQESSVVKEPKPYRNTKPLVYYGSSVTQGGCVSRPGMSYQAIISRTLDYDYINLGFSGSARAEDAIIDYIKNLDMSIFIYDYDYNSPTAEHLANTHEKMFKAIRQSHPNLPIIMMSCPKYTLNETEKIRRNIIETTYKNAINVGDKNVYFLDGKTLMYFCCDDGTADTIHPTDFGFSSMAKVLCKVIKQINVI